MSGRRDLLVEIGTEELPPKALWRLAAALAGGIEQGLTDAGLAPESLVPYATPRRLAVLLRGLAEEQPQRTIERRGPPVSAAFDAAGQPTKAAEGFARKQGTTVEALERQETDKGAWLVFRAVEPGEATRRLIPGIVDTALAELPIPRRMRWGAGEVSFVRPVHWAVMLFGSDVIDTQVLGVATGRETRGHRFHHPDPIALATPAEYAERLRNEGWVMADFQARRASIEAQVASAGEALGGRTLAPEGLLDEVTALVEWPVALTGSFDPQFLALPREVLVASMTGHQRYFPVQDQAGQLLAHFVAVANLASRDPDEVRRGNERVIRPRLADAAFFWEADRRTALEDRRPALGNMVFQERLGTLRDKTLRVETLAGHVAQAMGEDPAPARRAAELAKCDLLTQMVDEFPELQGVMGRYYARHDGEPEAVAQAIAEQYQPSQAGGEIPASAPGQALAVADRLDTLVGIFAVGQGPSGDKDPFGLRRAGVGILRILIEGERDVDLRALVDDAVGHLPEGLGDAALGERVWAFLMERLRGWYLDQGVRPDVFEAVAAHAPSRPLDFHHRVRAVQDFKALPEAEALAAANKRIQNILRQATDTVPEAIDEGLLQEPAERELYEQLQQLPSTLEAARTLGRVALLDQEPPAGKAALGYAEYSAALKTLAGLRGVVDRFFDEVLVMADDDSVRRNRLALLRDLAQEFLKIADISRLQPVQ